MTRRILRAIFSLVLRVFFRRIEVRGGENVPAEGPVMFTPNHPSGLVDPLFLFCLAPRRTSFLAKAPLFRMPVLGWLVRTLECLPVYRQSDAADTTKNRETFDAARKLLAGGGTITIFPEGTSHSDPHLKPLKTGAARIALEAGPIDIVPSGLFYTDKGTFRSQALLFFGTPFRVEPGTLAPETVHAVTDRIGAALADVTLQADRAEALALVARVERMFFFADDLAEQLDVRRRLIAGYERLRTRDPERLAVLERRITQFEHELEQAGIAPDRLSPEGFTATGVAGFVARSLLLFSLTAPFAVFGTVLHYPAYRAAGFFALRLSRGDDDIVATIKVLGSLVFFPLTWAAAATAAGLLWHWPAALATLALAPAGAYAALLFSERLDRLIAGARSLGLFLFRRRGWARLCAERDAIRNEIIAIGEAYTDAA
jgi:1-acyl-sn-glycerol-3-phosphate acyltransferase